MDVALCKLHENSQESEKIKRNRCILKNTNLFHRNSLFTQTPPLIQLVSSTQPFKISIELKLDLVVRGHYKQLYTPGSENTYRRKNLLPQEK